MQLLNCPTALSYILEIYGLLLSPALPSLQPLGRTVGKRPLQPCDLQCSSEGNISPAFLCRVVTPVLTVYFDVLQVA